MAKAKDKFEVRLIVKGKQKIRDLVRKLKADYGCKCVNALGYTDQSLFQGIVFVDDGGALWILDTSEKFFNSKQSDIVNVVELFKRLDKLETLK